MNNNFSSKTFKLFDRGGWIDCWECGKSNGDCLHHILKRISNSPYNVAPLNNFECHMPEGRKGKFPLSSQTVISNYLIKTKKYLDSIGYIPNKKDLEFLEQNKKYYENTTMATIF